MHSERLLIKTKEYIRQLLVHMLQGKLILFVDETGIKWDACPKKLWSLSKNSPKISRRKMTQNMSLISAFSIENYVAFKMITGPVNSSSFGAFLLELFMKLRRRNNIKYKPVIVLIMPLFTRQDVSKTLISYSILFFYLLILQS